MGSIHRREYIHPVLIADEVAGADIACMTELDANMAELSEYDQGNDSVSCSALLLSVKGNPTDSSVRPAQ